MKTFFAMTKRNIKMFFKDKGMFFTSLITPVILLVLYSTFLAKVYKDSFESALPQGFGVSDTLINGTVGGELFSSLLAVCCVTVAFCSNMLMVQDKANGTRRDFVITPTKKSVLAISYFTASLATTLIVSYVATAACFVYIAIKGWYFSFGDVILILLDVFMLTVFGVAISSVINAFLSSQGQISAVGTVVSAGYGFICGAYMPLASFGEGIRNVVMFLPGTYGTSLIRNHALAGVFREMSSVGFPDEVVKGIKDGIDCNLYFFGHSVSTVVMYAVMLSSILLLITSYVLINVFRRQRR
ncbi:MAG: ABC transporter permease [Eubacteriales bacterium]|nr:ABC transporter permease [Eubacteriales bacterium]